MLIAPGREAVGVIVALASGAKIKLPSEFFTFIV
jgi:hypothetical protein